MEHELRGRALRPGFPTLARVVCEGDVLNGCEQLHRLLESTKKGRGLLRIERINSRGDMKKSLVIIVVLWFATACVAQSKSADVGNRLETAKVALNTECQNRQDKFDTQSDKFVDGLVGDSASRSGLSTALGITSQVYQIKVDYTQVCLDTAELLLDARTEHEVVLLKKSMLLRLSTVMKAYAKLLAGC